MIRSRAFRIELYPDTETYDCYSVMKYIRNHYDYVFVMHDKDRYEEDSEDHKKGDLKKKHFHYVIRWAGNPRYASGLSKEFGVPERFFLPVYGKNDSKTGLKSSLTYLIHKDELEKYQYAISDVKGKGKLYNLFLTYVTCDRQYTKEEVLLLLMDFIEQQQYCLTKKVMKYSIQNGWIDIYHKYSHEIHRILDEHNYHYAYKDYD